MISLDKDEKWPDFYWFLLDCSLKKKEGWQGHRLNLGLHIRGQTKLE